MAAKWTALKDFDVILMYISKYVDLIENLPLVGFGIEINNKEGRLRERDWVNDQLCMFSYRLLQW